jgi:hypothetical protein
MTRGVTGDHGSAWRVPERIRTCSQSCPGTSLVSIALCVLLLVLSTGSIPVQGPEKFSAEPPPHVLLQEYEVEVPCQIGVFIDEQNPTTNYNTAMQGGYLRVGTGPEFCGKLWTLLDIGPVAQSNGGPLPDGVTITNARIKIRKESGPSDSIKVYGLQQGFNESSVTWNNKPARYEGSQTATTTVPASNGWTYLNIPTFVLNDAINNDHGVRVALCPTWTTCSRSIAFFSDDHTYRPSLVITYLGSGPEPTPPTPPVLNDTTPCQLQVTWTPPNPSPGQTVTVNAVAVDNEEMEYVAIYRGSQELARRDASAGQTSLSLSYSAEAELPSMNYIVAAKDSSPYTTQVIRTVNIPVRGTNTAPEVSVEIDWEIDEVIPERYRLIRGDGQVATITVTASDPEGIDYMDIQCTGFGAWQIDGHSQRSVTQTFDWVNNDPSVTTFSCRLSAVDLEGNYSSTDPEYIDIAGPGDLILMSTAAPGFHNPSRDRLPWERMVQTFGVSECYWLPPDHWKSWYALIWYHAGFKNIGDGGECFGMSTMAAEIYQNRVTANEIEPSASAASYMSYDNTFTKEFVEARQGGQLGEEVAFKRYNQRYQSTSEKLGNIKSDLLADRPGVLSISEGDGGHAIVPWMTRRMGDGTTRVYVYDCNREGGIVSHRDGGVDDPAFDFNRFNHYPYVEFDGSSWGYLWGDGTTWNDELAYFEYVEACGDMGQENPLGGPWDPHLTDHDIPSILQYMFAPIGGDVDVLIEDEDGNMTGIREGELIEEIPESMALVPMTGGSFTEHELYMLPIDKKLKLRVLGNSDGEYVLGLLGDGVLMALDQMDASEGSEDLITLEPWPDALGHKLRVRTAQATGNFQLIVAVMFEGVVMATDSDFIGREYIMDFAASLAGLDFSVFVEEGGDTLVVENHGEEDIVFDTTFSTTESLDEVGTDLSELPFIPSSGADDVTVGGGETLEVTPERWQTTEERGGLHILRDGKESGPQKSGFPMTPVIIGAAVLTAVAAFVVLLKKGVIRVGKPQ